MSGFEIHELVEATKDAYSFDRYGKAQWAKCCVALKELGLSRLDAEKVLRSKVMCWAADAYEDGSGVVYAFDFERYLSEQERPLRGLGLRSSAGRALS